MSTSSRKIEKILKEARVAIKNTQELPEIKEKISKLGFNDQRLKEGEEFLIETENRYRQQQELRGKKIDMTERTKDCLKNVRDRYMVLRKLSRREIRGENKEGLKKTLGIDGRARATMTGVLKEAAQFYDILFSNDELTQLFSKFGITKDVLSKDMADLEELKKIHQAQEKKKGESQQTRKERDDLYVELSVWLSQFKVACKSALANDPQQLEKLGILALSENYRRKKETKPDQPPAEKKEVAGQV